MEIWKDIQGYEGLYQVSNLGNVRSLNYGRRKEVKNIAVKRDSGYLRVCLSRNDKQKYFLVHRLVALQFVPGFKEGFVVNHKNEIKVDNRAENLEWCTQRENTNYGTRNERITKKTKKSVEQIDMNGNIVCVWDSATDAARAGFSNASISSCCHGKKEQYRGYMWRFATKV